MMRALSGFTVGWICGRAFGAWILAEVAAWQGEKQSLDDASAQQLRRGLDLWSRLRRLDSRGVAA